MSARFSKERLQKSPEKSGSSFAPFKGEFTEAKQYFVSLVAAISAFIAFQAFLANQLGVPKWTAWLAFIPPVIVFLWKTVPRLIEWRHQRIFVKSAERDAVKPIPSASAASYFLIGPYGEERRGKYARADNVHVKVLDWLQKTGERILILTGSSGTGKSSLLNAFVIPALRESKPPCAVLLVRSFDNPLNDLRSQLFRPGVIWDKPPAEKANLPLIELIQYAMARLRRNEPNARLFVVFDQFEEFIILHTERSPLVDEMKALLRELQRTGVQGFLVLLSIRLDYRMFLEPLGVPALNLGNNWQDVPAFTLSDSARFITAPESGLQIAPERLQRVLTEAAAVDGTRGLIRPIVLNMLGSVLGRIADSPVAELPTRSLLAGDLRSVVNHKERRTVARTILPQMLTEADTKRPRSVGELSEATGSDPQVILGCLLDLELSGYVRQISRSAEIANRIWEVSHDFVARLLGQILKTPQQTFWGRVGPVLYRLSLSVWVVAAVALIVLAPWIRQVSVEDNLRKKFGFYFRETNNGGYFVQEIYYDSFKDLASAVPDLQKLGPIKWLDLSRCKLLPDVDALRELRSLENLYLSGCTSLTNVDVLKELKNLQTLDLSDTSLTNVDMLKELKNLKTLDLRSCTSLTNGDVLKELKNLQTLGLGDTSLTNVDALRELRSLKNLYLRGCTSLTNVDGLKELKNLQTLDLSDTSLTNVDMLKELKNLKTLELRGCTSLTNVDVLKELKNLQILELSGCTSLTNVDVLKELKNLQTLGLRGCTSLTNVDVLKELKDLQQLDLRGCKKLTEKVVQQLRAGLPRAKIVSP